MFWFVKSKRAQTTTDDETWREGGVSPTLNAFDQGDSRATVLVYGQTGFAKYTEGEVTTILASSHKRPEENIVVAPTLSASNNPSRSPQSSEVTAQVEATHKATGHVRRLTPIECERLQGFPDNWTAGQADTHRYKQMGNAVTVNVAHYIGWLIADA